MRLRKQIVLRLRSLFRRSRVESELARELNFHLEQQIRENLAAGMSPAEARASALRTIGGLAQIEEECRDARHVQWFENSVRDIRYALRNLAKAPVFAAVAVLSLALGIGANTAVFSLIDTVMLQTLPVRDPQQLVTVATSAMKIGNFNVSLTITDQTFDALSHATQLQGLTAIAEADRLNVAIDKSIQVRPGAFVAGNFFDLLGVSPAIGRTLNPSDNRREAAASGWPAMISYRLWQQEFAGHPDVLGRHVTVNTIPFTIVGVLPRSFRGVEIDSDADFVLPNVTKLQVDAGKVSAGFPGPDDWPGDAVGRLKPGVTPEAAQAELTVLLQQSMLAQKRPQDAKRTILLTPVARGLSWVRHRYEDGLTILMAVVGVVMLIAAANLASLMLSRSTARQREISIRMSLGSSRGRIIRQLLTEALLISVAGTAVGILFAAWAHSALTSMVLADQPSASLPFHWTFRLCGFIAGLCLLNAALFGLAPAIRSTRVPAAEVLRSGRNVGSTGVVRIGRWLISGQIALSLALVIGAVLLLRTLSNLYRVDLGFNPSNVLMFTTDPHLAGYEGERAAALYRELLAGVHALPGVEAVSMIRTPLLGAETALTRVVIPGYVPTDGTNDATNWIVYDAVGPNFFATVQMPLVAGRDFTDEGMDRTGKVAIINESMARHFFAGRNPVGEKIAVATTTPDVEIIGVAADAHNFGPSRQQQDVIFAPSLKPGIQQATVLVRTTGPPAELAGAVRAVVHGIAPNVPVFGVTTMRELLDDNLAQQRIIASLSAFFAALALVLSAIGIYGVLAYRVAQRTSEIGVRVALGATRTNIVRLVFRDTAAMLAVGVCAGAVLSLASAKLVRSVLFGVSPTDISAILVAIVILLAVAVFASLLPTRRALRIDPNVALREE